MFLKVKNLTNLTQLNNEKTNYNFNSIICIIKYKLNIFFIFKGETTKTNDNRIAVVMTPDNTDFVLNEMRDFLESIQQINEGILNNDAQKIIDAGKKSSDSVIDHAPKGLIKSLKYN